MTFQPMPALPLSLPPALAGRSLLLAYSGGGDSTALLHALAAARLAPLRAVHVHHGLQDVADEWAARCAQRCEALGVPFELRRVQVVDAGQGPEGAAREARYAALREVLAPGEVLVTAHHQDDQAETLLLRLLRGSGVAGLAGMTALAEFAPGLLWRPLLETPQAEVRAYAAAQGLDWVEDPHNRDPRYARSLVRHELLPLLRRRWPAAAQTLARASALQREAATLLQELAQQDLAAALRGPALDLTTVRALGPERRRNLLRHWLEQRGLPLPYQQTLQRVDAELIDARADGAPCLSWPGAELRRYRERLHAMVTLPPAPQGWRAAWPEQQSRLELPAGCGSLHAPRLPPACTVRVPAGVTRFRPQGSAQSRALKTLFQEHAVPPWVRQRTPALERAGEVLWIGGLGWRFDAEPFALEWRSPPPG